MMSTSLALDFARALDPTLIARDVGLDQLDDWQARLIDDPPKRLLCCCGRQVGKSTAAAVCALSSAIYSAPSTIVLISPSLRQSVELYRAFHALWQRLPGRPEAQYETLSRLELENGSRILALPGNPDNIVGFSDPSIIIIDEAARCPDGMFEAVSPMRAVSGGTLMLLSTPRGRRGFFWNEWEYGEGWERIQAKASECPRISAEFLVSERWSLGEMMYRQNYENEFVLSEDQCFSQSSIDRAFDSNIPALLGF